MVARSLSDSERGDEHEFQPFLNCILFLLMPLNCRINLLIPLKLYNVL